MANTPPNQNAQSIRSGPLSVVSGRIQAGVKAAVGDLCMLIGNYVMPAHTMIVTGSGSGSGSDAPSGGSALTDFKVAFLGILYEGATSGLETSDSPCLVATDCVAEIPVATGSIDDVYPPGMPVSAVINGTTLFDQQIQLTSGRTAAIALTARETGTLDSTLVVRIFSSIMGEPLS